MSAPLARVADWVSDLARAHPAATMTAAAAVGALIALVTPRRPGLIAGALAATAGAAATRLVRAAASELAPRMATAVAPVN